MPHDNDTPTRPSRRTPVTSTSNPGTVEYSEDTENPGTSTGDFHFPSGSSSGVSIGHTTIAPEDFNLMKTKIEKIADMAPTLDSMSTKLENLNKLNEMSTKLDSLSNLSKLNDMNASLGNLSKLSKLDTMDNSLKSLSKLDSMNVSLGSLNKLDKLETMDNSLKSLSKLDSMNTSLGSLNKLDKLKTMDNSLKSLSKLDSMSASLGSLSNLETMNTKLTDLNKLSDLNKLDKLNDMDTKLGRLNMLDDVKSKLTSLTEENTLSLYDSGDKIKELHENLSTIGINVPNFEKLGKTFGTGTRDAIIQLQSRYNLEMSGIFDEATRQTFDKIRLIPQSQQIHGRLLLPQGIPAGGVQLEFYSHGFGNVEPIQIEGTDNITTSIDPSAEGYYSVSIPDKYKAGNIEIRTRDKNNNLITLANIKLSTDKFSELNLVAPENIQYKSSTEYSRLFTDLTKELKANNLSALTHAQEDDERQDLTYLHRATNWDARLIAMATMAENVNQKLNSASIPEERINLSSKALYGLFRAGLPMDKSLLSKVDISLATQALGKMVDSKIVDISSDELKDFNEQFKKLAKTRFELPMPGSKTTYNELITH